MDSKKNVCGKKKLELSRETIKSLRVKSDVHTGLFLPGISGGCMASNVGCVVAPTKNPNGYCLV